MNVEVAFASEGRGVAFQTSGNTRTGWKAEMVKALPELAQRAVKVGETLPDARRVGDTRMFHTLVAPIEVNGRVYTAKITLRESLPKDPGIRHKFYDVAALEIDNGVAVSGLPSESTERIHPTPTTPLPVSVGDLVSAIKGNPQSRETASGKEDSASDSSRRDAGMNDGTPPYSFSPPLRNPETAVGVRASLDKALGRKAMDSLVRDGKVVIHETPESLPDDLKRGVAQAGNVSGIYDKKTKTIHLIASYIRQGDGAAKGKHEGWHLFLDALEHRDSRAFRAMINRLALIEKSGTASAWFERARARIPAADRARGDAVRLNELAAYAIEEYERAPRSLPQAVTKWVQDFIASIRAALMEHGFTPVNLSAADLAAISRRFWRASGPGDVMRRRRWGMMIFMQGER
jgi:hypothetical protein